VEKFLIVYRIDEMSGRQRVVTPQYEN